jgi:hypothetical protein
VANLPLGGRGCLHPLRRLSADTTHHVRMSKGLGRPLLRLNVEGGRDRLRDSGMERGGAAGNDQVAVGLVAGARPGIAVTRPRTVKGRVGIQ